jgi:hypothetical protein
VAALVGPYLGLDTVLSTAQASDDPQDATTATVARVTY